MNVHEAASGIIAIRQALRGRRNLPDIARDAGISAESLFQFLAGGSLAPVTLAALTTRIWSGHFEYVPDDDLLQSTNRAKPTSIGSPPPPVKPKPLGYRTGPQPLSPCYAAGGPRYKRPAWLKS